MTCEAQLTSSLKLSMGKPTQLELPLSREREPDRNLLQGGRSFYFFDFDDNVAFLTTPMFLFHRETGAEIEISSRQFALHSRSISKHGDYADYEMRPSAKDGSFRRFRDRELSWLERLLGRRQIFIDDLAIALGGPDISWKGPSWNCFYHAVFNGRPLSLITARGHHPQTLEKGIQLWVNEGHLPRPPNYLSIYPVSHPQIQTELGLGDGASIPLLKQKALRASVLKAFERYGLNPFHRFGMSDDDPRNIEWIVAEMRELKREFPENSFFVIQTHGEQFIKHEVFADQSLDRRVIPESQLTLFDE